MSSKDAEVCESAEPLSKPAEETVSVVITRSSLGETTYATKLRLEAPDGLSVISARPSPPVGAEYVPVKEGLVSMPAMFWSATPPGIVRSCDGKRSTIVRANVIRAGEGNIQDGTIRAVFVFDTCGDVSVSVGRETAPDRHLRFRCVVKTMKQKRVVAVQLGIIC